MIDWNASVAWIALVVSILTPSITTIITTIHQYKLKKLEMRHADESAYFEKRDQVFHTFLKCTGQFINYTSTENENNYGSGFYEIFLFTPSILWPTIEALEKSIRSNQISDAQDILLQLSQELADIAKTRSIGLK